MNITFNQYFKNRMGKSTANIFDQIILFNKKSAKIQRGNEFKPETCKSYAVISKTSFRAITENKNFKKHDLKSKEKCNIIKIYIFGNRKKKRSEMRKEKMKNKIKIIKHV